MGAGARAGTVLAGRPRVLAALGATAAAAAAAGVAWVARVARAGDDWCETDPPLVIKTPAGRRAAVAYPTGALGQEHAATLPPDAWRTRRSRRTARRE